MAGRSTVPGFDTMLARDKLERTIIARAAGSVARAIAAVRLSLVASDPALDAKVAALAPGDADHGGDQASSVSRGTVKRSGGEGGVSCHEGRQ